MPVKAIAQVGAGDVGGSCDACRVNACLADREGHSSRDLGFGGFPVHIDRLHADSGGRKPSAELFSSEIDRLPIVILGSCPQRNP